MGLTKQYLRYEASNIFGIVGSAKANIVFLSYKGTKGRYCAVGACEQIFVWDLRKAEKVLTLTGDKNEVAVLCASPDGRHLAAGYTDGSVKVYDLDTGDLSITFSGHRSAVTALNYDKEGAQLVSGAQDTDIIIWDIINECGLYRLKGHKGVITQARFMKDKNILITSSKDFLVKFWDLETQHCFKTLTEHRSEVWDFVLLQEDACLVTGAADSELRVWKLLNPDAEGGGPPAKKKKDDATSDDESEEDEYPLLRCEKHGSITRQGRGRVQTLSADPTGRLLGCHSNDKKIELFKVCTKEETAKLINKKQKKAKKRAREKGEDETDVNIEQSLEDEIKRLAFFETDAKLRAFDSVIDTSGSAKVSVLQNSNQVELFKVDLNESKPEAEKASQLSLPGHRTDVRTLAFSSDSTAIVSGSAETLKIWNRSSLQCIRSMKCGYALCSLFAPGDRHIIVGTKAGKLEIHDVAAGVLLEEIDAHDGAVWSITMSPDKKSIVSGSADKLVKFWDFELVTDAKYSQTSKRLTLEHTRTLKMSEDVLGVKLSPDQKLLAVSLLDNTVKVFFADTLKFFLSLYGHKLPVLCMDISTDSSLIVTGSADRNVKLWGLDFGDCHKSIFAHDDSIMCVQFVPKTHLFFTGGKDGKVKQWDGDSFDLIQTLKGHQGEVWSLAVSVSGNLLVSSSHDKSLRLWEKTQEPLVLEEEREMEREQQQEEAAAEGEQPVVPGEANSEIGIAGRKTMETVKAAEKIMEALELYKTETAKLIEYEAECKATKKEIPKPPVHPMMQAFNVHTPKHYVLEVLKKIKSSELEEALLVLPFSYVMDLLELLNAFLEAGWQVELSSRCISFLLRIHQGQITTNQVLLPVIEKLKQNSQEQVGKLRDTIGFNLAGLKFLKQQIEEKEEVQLFADATERMRQKKRKIKKKALLTIRS